MGHRGAVVHRDLGRGGELALQCADDEKPHDSLLFLSFAPLSSALMP
jgi:hypothetical protein